MSNVLILGANGRIAKIVSEILLKQKEHELTLFLRNKSRVDSLINDRTKIIEGDADNLDDLTKAMSNIDVVYANLSGESIVNQANNVIKAMGTTNVKRLIWVSTLGIYNEIPGEFGQFTMNYLSGGYIENYTEATKIVENSGLEVTIIRPGWLDDYNEIDYEITHRNEPFKGTEVSRKSVADLIVKLINDPQKYVNDSLGVNKPNMDYPKPKWLL